MYIPKHFEITDLGEVARFVAEIRSADLVTVGPDGVPLATLMPCIWDQTERTHSEFGKLIMHMARGNQQWKSIESGANGLAIIHGPEAYISPSNYERKLTDHKVVPTWNYQSVHLSGTVEISHDLDLLRDIVTNLTNFHEVDRSNSWEVADADSKYIDSQLRGIVAVTMYVTRVEAKYKLSQNRSVRDRETVIADLTSSNDYENQLVADEMKKTL